MKRMMSVSVAIAAVLPVLATSVNLPVGVSVESQLVRGDGGLSYTSAGRSAFTEVVENAYPSTGNGKLFLAGRLLSEIEPWKAEMDGAAAGTGWVKNLVRTNGVLDVDFMLDDGTWIKSVKVVFYQNGDDIWCRALYARAGRKSNGFNLGSSLDRTAWNTAFLTESSTRDSENASVNAYGVKNVFLRPAGGVQSSTVQFDGGVVPNGPLVFDSGVSGVVTGSVAYAASAIGEVSLTNASVVFSAGVPGVKTVITNAFSGAGGRIRYTDRDRGESDFRATLLTGAAAEWKANRIVASRRQLTELTNLCVRAVGMQGNDPGITVFVGHWRSTDAGSRLCQVQYNDGSYLKCIVLEFTQSGEDIVAKSIRCLYRGLGWYGDKTVVDDDLYARYLKGSDDGTKDPNNHVYYWVSDMDLLFSSPAKSVVELAGSVTCEPCEIEIGSGLDVQIVNAAAISDTVSLSIASGAVTRVCIANATGPAKVEVAKSGVFSVENQSGVSQSTRYILNGGRLDANVLKPAATYGDSGIYVNHVDFLNGAVMCSSLDRDVRVGNNFACYRIRGNVPSRNDCTLRLVKKSDCALTFDVDDVTGDDASDFIQAGVIRDFNDTYKGMPVCKTGEGTMLLSAAATAVGPLTVADGTLQLALADAVATFGSLKMAGGCIAAEVTQDMPPLTLAGNAALDCMENGTFAFGDSSANAWTEGARLDLINYRAKSVRFGTSSSGLSWSQIRALRVDGRHVLLDDEGYVVPRGDLSIIVR